jgi:hypothetical protein
VLCSDSNTDRKAAVPVAPALGGKLKMGRHAALGALAAAQVDQLADAGGQRVGPLDAAVHVVRSTTFSKRQAWLQPVQAICVPLARPPNTIAPVAPSSSGMATMMVAPPAAGRAAARHWSSVWNSTGCTASRARPAREHVFGGAASL